MKVAVLSSNSVALAFSRFVFFEVESSCFLKQFSKSVNRNTWHSFNTSEELVDLTASSKETKKFYFCCPYAPIETEFEHVAESIHKRILEVNDIQLVIYFFTQFIPMSKKCWRGPDREQKFGVWFTTQ